MCDIVIWFKIIYLLCNVGGGESVEEVRVSCCDVIYIGFCLFFIKIIVDI